VWDGILSTHLQFFDYERVQGCSSESSLFALSLLKRKGKIKRSSGERNLVLLSRKKHGKKIIPALFIKRNRTIPGIAGPDKSSPAEKTVRI